MRSVSARIVAVVVAGLVPAAAFAGAPGSNTREIQFRHLCQSGPSAGGTCDPEVDDSCGLKSNGEPHPCVIDLLKRPVLRGTLTVVADENPADNDSLAGNPVINAVLEIKLKGKTYFFAKSFQSSTLGNWPEIAAWNAPTSEAEIKLLKDTWPFQHPKFALGPFQGAIDDMVEEVWPGLFDLTGRVPLIVEAVPAIVEAKLTDQYPDADLGQVVRLKVRIQYAAPVV